MRKTIGGQLIILIVGSILLSQAVILSIFFVKTDTRLEQFENKLLSEEILSSYVRLLDTETEQREDLAAALSTREVDFTITPVPLAEARLTQKVIARRFPEDFTDIPVYFSGKEGSLSSIFEFWFSEDFNRCEQVSARQVRSSDCPYVMVSFPLNDKTWLNSVAVSSPDELIILLPAFISVGLSLVTVVLVVIFSVRRITAPLRNLSVAAEKFGLGEPIGQLESGGLEELSSTTDAFNQMQQRLARFIEDRTSMLAAISHDLRTPITSLRLRAEFISDPDLQSKMIATLEDMENMVEACLTFAKQEIQEEGSTQVDLVSMLQGLADDSSHITFSCAPGSVQYSCKKVNFKRAISNLLENAVRYGEAADMLLESSKEQIRIEIRDRGPGIPEDKLEAVFEPFVRLDQARHTEHGSVGLGLAIARTIIHKHGRTIELKNMERGLQVSVLLPRSG